MHAATTSPRSSATTTSDGRWHRLHSWGGRRGWGTRPGASLMMRSSHSVHRSCQGWRPDRGIVGGRGHDGAVTTTERADTTLRPRAEEVLRGLAGPAARLRDDQWTAIHALVVQRRRALVVQRTGWGKSAVYFVATALLRAAGAGPTVIVSPLLALMRNQIDAAARAGRAGGHDQLGQHRRLGGHLRGDRRRRGGRPAGQPGAAEQPRLPRPGAPPAHRERGSAGGGRGALRLGLGARLPARLPPPARADRRAAAGDPGAGHHGDGERPGGPRRHRAAGARVRGAAGAARLAGPREPAAVGRAAADARAAARVARRAPGGAAGRRDRLHAHGRRRGRGRGVPARARVPGRVLHRQDRSGAAAGRGGGPAGEPGQGAGGHQRAGHGVRQAGPRLRRAPRRAVLARRLLPADRPGRARGASGPRWCCCRARRTATSGPTSPRSPSRPSRSCAGRWRCCRTARCRPPRSRPGSTCRAPAWRCC